MKGGVGLAYLTHKNIQISTYFSYHLHSTTCTRPTTPQPLPIPTTMLHTAPSMEDYFDLARQGIRLYGTNKDPLTAAAIEILFRCDRLPLSEAEQNAALLLKNQLQAYKTLHIDPLM